MSDTQALIADHRPRYDDGRFRCACSAGPWILYSSFADHLAEVIAAEFLVIPRTAAEVEYSCEWKASNGVTYDEGPYRRREGAAEIVAGIHAAQSASWGSSTARLVSRLVGRTPWSPIPLPEDGQS